VRNRERERERGEEERKSERVEEMERMRACVWRNKEIERWREKSVCRCDCGERVSEKERDRGIKSERVRELQRWRERESVCVAK